MITIFVSWKAIYLQYLCEISRQLPVHCWDIAFENCSRQHCQ